MSVWSCLIFTFALLKNMKLCPGQHYILGHSAVISDTVYLKPLLMVKELIGTSMMNVEHSNQFEPSYQKTWNSLCKKIPEPLKKSSRKVWKI